MTLRDFLAPTQIAQALAIWKASTTPAQEIADKVIGPNLAEINRRLGQDNDPKFLAYACEHTFNQTETR